MSKLIITCALCGVGTTKEQNPNVPITPDEIAADAVECVKAGASVLHVHVRDKNGVNAMDKNIFAEVVGKIRDSLAKEGLDSVINVTTSGSKFSYEERMSHLELVKPEMCSYDPGTMNWANSYVFLNEPKFLEELGTLTQKLGVKPELEIFDAGMIGNIEPLHQEGLPQDALSCAARAGCSRRHARQRGVCRLPPAQDPCGFHLVYHGHRPQPCALHAHRPRRGMQRPQSGTRGQHLLQQGRARHEPSARGPRGGVRQACRS